MYDSKSPQLERPECFSVLFVEDDEDIRTNLSKLLRRRIQLVVQAENGMAGLKLYKKYTPDIIISDYNMPIMNGLQFAQSIRENGSKTPIIFFTSETDSEILLRLQNVSCSRVVEKPLKIDKLVSALEWAKGTMEKN